MVQGRFFFFTLLVILTLFIFGCLPALEILDNKIMVSESKAWNDSEEVAEEAGSCLPRWDCLSSIYKAYQLGNCSWVDRQECRLGCVAGACREAKVCTRGFKCLNEYTRGLQIESCEWIIKKPCSWGCADGVCQSKPNATLVDETEAAEKEEPSVPPLEKSYLLPVGAEDAIEFKNQQYILSTVLLESARVQIEINGRRSNWLKEGDSFAYNGIKITVVEILFQPYEEGTQAISYQVGDGK